MPSPYLTRLRSIGAIERDSVVTTLIFSAIRLARWNAASPMPIDRRRRRAPRGLEAGVVETGHDERVGVTRALSISSRSPGTENASSK